MKKGFTLIELLVVVLIIGILSAVALPKYQNAVRKARAVQQLTLIKSVKDALDLFYIETGGEEIPTLDALSIEMPPDSEDLEVSVNKVNNVGYYASVNNHTMGDERFVLRYFINCRYPEYERKIICVGEGDGGEKTCKGLGGKNEHSYKFISRQKAYYLD